MTNSVLPALLLCIGFVGATAALIVGVEYSLHLLGRIIDRRRRTVEIAPTPYIPQSGDYEYLYPERVKEADEALEEYKLRLKGGRT